MRTEKEPIIQNESEIICSFCGPPTIASWEVVLTDGEHAYICYPDYKNLLEAELILGDRRIGKMVWEDVVELREFLNHNEQRGKAN
jgi:hypothetical protein